MTDSAPRQEPLRDLVNQRLDRAKSRVRALLASEEIAIAQTYALLDVADALREQTEAIRATSRVPVYVSLPSYGGGEGGAGGVGRPTSVGTIWFGSGKPGQGSQGGSWLGMHPLKADASPVEEMSVTAGHPAEVVKTFFEGSLRNTEDFASCDFAPGSVVAAEEGGTHFVLCDDGMWRRDPEDGKPRSSSESTVSAWFDYELVASFGTFSVVAIVKRPHQTEEGNESE